MTTNRNQNVWLKKQDLYGPKLMGLLQRNEFNKSLTSSFRIDEFIFQNMNDTKRREMEAYLKGSDTRSILNKMIELKKDMKDEIRHTKNYLQQMNLSKYRNYKNNPSIDLRIPVRNIDATGDLIYNDHSLSQFSANGENNKTSPNYQDLDRLIRKGYQTLPPANKSTFNRNSNKIANKSTKDIIRKSIDSQFYWKNTDLTQHALGSPNDLARLAIRIVERDQNPLGTVSYLNQIFFPHLESTQHGAFAAGIANLKAFVSSNRYPIADDPNSKTFREMGGTPSLETINIILEDEKTAQNNKAKEFLIIYMIDIFQNISRIYKEVAKLLRSLKPQDSALHLATEKSIKSLTMFLNNTIKNFFSLDGLYTPYGFAKSRETKNGPAESANKGGFFRVIGSMDVVKDLSKFRTGEFPIVIRKANNDFVLDKGNSLQNFQKMFLGKQNKMKDAKTGETIYMGGFIMKSPYDELSIKILGGAFNKTMKDNQKRIEIADKVITGSKEMLNVNDLVQIKNEIFTDLDDVASYKNPALRNTAFKTALNEIIRKYIKYRDAEIQDLIQTVRFSGLLRKYDITKPDNARELARILDMSNSEAENLTDEIMEAKEKLIVKLNYHQLMAIAYRVLSLRILAIINAQDGEERMPERYFDLMKMAFRQADAKILKKTESMKISGINSLRDKIKSTLNLPNITINDIGIKVNNRKTSNKKVNRGNNYGLFGDLMAMENSGNKNFWENLSNSMKGYSIYIPYVNVGGMYGIFNVTKAAERGKIINSDFISSVYLTEKRYSSRIAPSGYIIVSGDSRDLKNPKAWRVVSKAVLTDAEKLSSKDLRMFLYNLLFSRAVYHKKVDRSWSDSSKAKQNLVKYCSKLVSERASCPLTIGQDRLSSFV